MIKIIAEAGLAHMGRMELAKKLVTQAKQAGANYVKFQVYKTEELIHPDRDSVRFKRFKERELSYEQHAELKKFAENEGIEYLATPHTVGAFHFLEDLGVSAFKIGSGDRGEIFSLAHDTGKPTFVSLGIRSWEEVQNILDKEYHRNIYFLHCVTRYPVPFHEARLNILAAMIRNSLNEIGYSDHCIGNLACFAAATLGAQVIEKHIRLDVSIGQDNLCALYKWEFSHMVQRIREIEEMIEPKPRICSPEEEENKKWALKGPDGLRPLVDLS